MDDLILPLLKQDFSPYYLHRLETSPDNHQLELVPAVRYYVLPQLKSIQTTQACVVLVATYWR